jgi:hypothetical protein
MSSSTARRSSSPLATKHSEPIAIPGGGHHYGRHRSDSASSDSTEGSPPPITPAGLASTFGGRAAVAGSPTSPIMTMLAAGTPMKSPVAFPFTKMPLSAVDDEEAEHATSRHARRASMNAGSRFVPPMNPSALAGSTQERGANVLRRLSLGGTFGRANVAPPQPPSPPRGRDRTVEPPVISAGPPVVGTPVKRRGTLPGFTGNAESAPARANVSPPRVRRAPSPMGERMLKGHFDSFH